VGRICGTLGEDRKVKKVWRESLKERGHTEDPGVDGIRIDFGETGCGSAFNWLRRGVIGGLL
jgi:hypothetical protein